MKLYYNPLSPNCRRVLLTAAQLGVSLEEQVLDLTKGEHKSADYLAINPNGMVPTLVDGKLNLWESRAILQYLASKKPTAGLLGKNENERIDIMRWQCWDAAHLSTQVGTLIWENMLKGMFGMGAPDQKAVAAAMEQVKRFCGVLDTSLKGKKYLVGDSLTVADLTIAATFTYAGPLNIPVSSFPNLKAWFERITALDAWKKTQPTLPKKAA
jgi:glutathione S-transferase